VQAAPVAVVVRVAAATAARAAADPLRS